MLNQKWVRGKNLRVLNTVIKPANLSGMKVKSMTKQTTQTIYQKNNTIDNYYKPIINKVNKASQSIKRSRIVYEEDQISESDEMNIDDTTSVSTDSQQDSDFGWDEFNTLSPIENVDVNSDNKDLWVSATKSANYLLNDTLLDWLILYYDKFGYNEFPNGNYTYTVKQHRKQDRKQEMEEEKKELSLILQGGLEFEALVNKEIETKYPNDVKRVVERYVNMNDYQKTLEYMKAGVPIIIQAAVYNFNNKTFGVIDLLIRSDFVNKIFNSKVLTSTEEHLKAPLLNGNYHYIVIDIKWSGMHIRSNEPTLRNKSRFKAYKGQLAIYNAGIGQMQGYTPQKAYILAKSWKREYTRNKQTFTEHGYDCFDRLGVIDFTGYDHYILKETHEAIQWIRNTRINGQKWSCINPIIPELYPNMNNRYDAPFHSVKKDLAELNKELTQITHVEVKHRKHAHTLGIKSWDNPKCTAKNMGFKGGKLMKLVDRILKVQQGEKIISPDKIKSNDYNWKNESPCDYYMDYEDAQPELNIKNMNVRNSEPGPKLTFMIGLVYRENDEMKYKCFLANQLTIEEEKRIYLEKINFITQKTIEYNRQHNTNYKPRIFHWSQAEPINFKSFSRRYNHNYDEWFNSVIWVDMHKIFKNDKNEYEDAIIVKDALGFSLKKVNNAMFQHGMVETQWPTSGPGDGLGAMSMAIKYYSYKQNHQRDLSLDESFNREMQSIIDYNEVDCRAVYEIVNYLRKNH